VVVYTPDSFSVFQLIEAARGLCRVLWVVDRGVYDSFSDNTSIKLMRRFGRVIETESRSFDEIVNAVAGERPNGIATFDDSGQLLAARLAIALGLEFHSVEVVERLTDKVAQRTALRAAGFPTPRFWIVPQAEWSTCVERILSEATFPLVVKPCRGSASRDAYRADDPASLRSALEQSRREDVIVEEFLPDPVDDSVEQQDFASFVSVESVIKHAQVTHLAVTGRFPLAAPFRAAGCSFRAT